MENTTAAYEKLRDRFVQWAETEDNIRAAVVIGSRARADHPADEWSDLDIIIFAHDPTLYWVKDDWLRHVGKYWLTFVEPTGIDRGFERRVLFEGGLDVDFAPDSVDELEMMLDHGFPPEIADIMQRGMRFLLDKDGYGERIQGVEMNQPVYTPPTESEFLNVVHDFWYHTVWTGKHLRRGELWWAKSGCDSHLKHLLRQMLEWHARASNQGDVDTWMRGRFLEEWADPRALEALPAVFAHYDEEDIWRALLATMALFRWLAVETADAYAYTYPASGEEQAVTMVQALFAGSSAVKITEWPNKSGNKSQEQSP